MPFEIFEPKSTNPEFRGSRDTECAHYVNLGGPCSPISPSKTSSNAPGGYKDVEVGGRTKLGWYLDISVWMLR